MSFRSEQTTRKHCSPPATACKTDRAEIRVRKLALRAIIRAFSSINNLHPMPRFDQHFRLFNMRGEFTNFMKRCPECRRDYYDDTLLYCLDDGNALLEGPAASEPATLILGEERGSPNPGNEALGLEVDGLPTMANLADTARTEMLPVSEGTHNKHVSVLWIVIGTFLVAGLIVAVWKFGGSTTSKQNGPNLPDVAPTKNAPNPAAYDNYLRAKVLLASENRDEVGTAIKLLEEAVKQDPEYALAWAALARAYNVKAFYFADGAERKQLNENAEVAVLKALAINPDLAEAHFARGLLLWTHAKRFPHEQAIQSYKRALELDPTLDEAHHQLGLIYMHLGLLDKAQSEIQKTLEINPGNTLARFRFGVVDLYRGNYEAAYEFFKSTPLEKNPSLHAFQIATALFNLGRVQEATESIDKYLRDYPHDEGGVGTSVRAMIFAKSGNAAKAEESILRAEEIGKDFGHFHHAAYNIAVAYALMNRPERAVEYLQLAADDGFPCYPLFANDENLKNLRHDLRFVTFLAKSKQQWERYNATL